MRKIIICSNARKEENEHAEIKEVEEKKDIFKAEAGGHMVIHRGSIKKNGRRTSVMRRGVEYLPWKAGIDKIVLK